MITAFAAMAVFLGPLTVFYWENVCVTEAAAWTVRALARRRGRRSA